MSEATPMFRTVELYASSTKATNLVTKAVIPKFLDGVEPDVLIWGSRFFKKAADRDENGNWKYVECFVYTVLRSV